MDVKECRFYWTYLLYIRVCPAHGPCGGDESAEDDGMHRSNWQRPRRPSMWGPTIG
jgi:hypothetical protein